MADAIHTTDITLGVEPAEKGARFFVEVQTGTGTLLYALLAEREGARNFAHAVLAACGDGTQRTFPKPAPEVGRA